jgi:hypothetical protein
MHADVCTEWVKGMHFTDHWGEITRLSERAEPHAELLASHPGLEHDSLAKTALVGLGSAFAFQAYHHAATYLTKLQDAQDFDILSEEARTALTLGIPWARRASQVSQEGSQEGGQARDVLANLLGNRGGLWYREFQIRAELVEALITQGGGLFHCEAKIREKRDEAIELLRCAARDVKEAAKWRPNDEAVMQAYGVIKHGLATLGLSDEEEEESTLGEELPSVDRSEAAPPVPATLTMGSVTEASHRTVNIWRRGALEQNPYARTKFRVARVPREVVRHRTVVNLINQTRQIVRGDPAAHAIRGIPVTAAEVLVAEQVLLDPRQRILEELLHHATERLPMERTRELAGEAANLLGADDPGPLSVTKPEALRILATEIGRLCYESAPAPTPSLGSLELELPPPFGRQEEM